MQDPNNRSVWAVPGIFVLLLAGCGGSTERGPVPSETVQAAAPTVTLAAPVHHLDLLAREPMFVEHPSGALFLSGYGSQVTGTDPRARLNLWTSTDGGDSWTRVDVGTPEDGAMGNSDVDLAVGPEGVLYFLALGFDRSVREGTHVTIGVSRDIGATWSWTLLSETRFDDRPWVEVTPDGTAHVIWNDGSGVRHAASHDRGRTWQELERIHPEGGSSHLAVGPKGEIAVRIVPFSASGNRFDEGVDLIAVSADGGMSWQKRPAPGQRTWDPTGQDPTLPPRWVEPVAWDASGALYSLWSEGRELRLARSVDRGESWHTWSVATETDLAFFPYLVAGPAGELAATWFTGEELAPTWFTGGGDSLAAHVALFIVPEADDAELEIARVDPFQPLSWLETLETRSLTPAGEYLPVAFLADGDLGVASPIQDLQGKRFGFSWWRVEVHRKATVTASVKARS